MTILYIKYLHSPHMSLPDKAIRHNVDQIVFVARHWRNVCGRALNHNHLTSTIEGLVTIMYTQVLELIMSIIKHS